MVRNSISPSKTLLEPLSIIIPFRNENTVIQNLVNALVSELDTYPNSELILVNDSSTDGGKEALESSFSSEPQIRILESAEEGKKSALTTGINSAKNEWIITLDADITLPKNWMKSISGICATAEDDLLILPVQISNQNRLFQFVESLEFLVLQVITFYYAYLKRPFLCNGAHMAFKKSTFNSLNGYESHKHLSSGDDVFFLEQVIQSDNHTAGYSYSQDITVNTKPSESLKKFLYQKIRWAKKTGSFKSLEIVYLTAIIGLVNLILVALVFLGFWKGFLLGFLLKSFLKSLADLMILKGSFHSRNKKLKSFLPFFMLIYPFYFTFVGIATLFINPTWKGRKVK